MNFSFRMSGKIIVCDLPYIRICTQLTIIFPHLIWIIKMSNSNEREVSLTARKIGIGLIPYLKGINYQKYFQIARRKLPWYWNAYQLLFRMLNSSSNGPEVWVHLGFQMQQSKCNKSKLRNFFMRKFLFRLTG